MRRRKGVMCGSVASERGVVRDNPFRMPHRSKEGANENQREAEGVTSRRADNRGAGQHKRARSVGDKRSSGSSFLPTAKRFSSPRQCPRNARRTASFGSLG